jgi:hypothetical protein
MSRTILIGAQQKQHPASSAKFDDPSSPKRRGAFEMIDNGLQCSCSCGEPVV